jgi:hypothetical protein
MAEQLDICCVTEVTFLRRGLAFFTQSSDPTDVLHLRKSAQQERVLPETFSGPTIGLRPCVDGVRIARQRRPDTGWPQWPTRRRAIRHKDWAAVISRRSGASRRS